MTFMRSISRHSAEQLHRSAVTSRQAWRLSMAVAVATLMLGACLPAGGADAIKIEREVLVPGLRGNLHGMAQLPNGGFVIVGEMDAAWAAGTDANGELLWKYEEPVDTNVPRTNKSAFHDATILANGQILLCGEARTKYNDAGLIVTLDGRGNLIERRLLFPNDQHGDFGSFDKITPWGDGFAISGWGTDQKKSYFWLVRLDKSGAKEWDKVRGDLTGMNTVALSDQTLIQAGRSNEGGIRIVRLDQQARLVAERSTDFFEAKPLQPFGPTNRIRVLAMDGAYRNFLLTLKGNLQDEKRPDGVGPPNIHDGCAFDLPDGSVALFGNQLISGGAFRSTIGRWGSRQGLLQMPVPNPQVSSYSFVAAVRVGPNRFVAMRDQVSRPDDPGNTGVVLSWVAFN